MSAYAKLCVVFLIIGAILFFAPTIIAFMRNTKAKTAIAIINAVSVFLFSFSISLPLIVWAVLLLVAFLSKPKLQFKLNNEIRRN